MLAAVDPLHNEWVKAAHAAKDALRCPIPFVAGLLRPSPGNSVDKSDGLTLDYRSRSARNSCGEVLEWPNRTHC